MLELGREQLSALEQMQIRFIRRTLAPGALNRSVRFCQRTVGQAWINTAIGRIRHLHGVERLPPFEPGKSYILVANHRSFFDLYVVTAALVRRGLEHRILFPVRANFFYDHPLGIVVNGLMSFFAMYPPVFRDRARQALNLAGLDELADLLDGGGLFVGLHPEGTRNKSGDPYDFLPAQSGVGRIIHRSNAVVIPVFINGLINDLPKQVGTGLIGTGEPIMVVFGDPIDLADLRQAAPSPRIYRATSERALDRVRALGEEERALRARAG